MTYVDRLLTATSALRTDRPATIRPVASDAGHPELAPLLSVLFSMIDETRSMVINVTSAHPGAGVSTVARRLAEAAAAVGWCRVALLDARPAAGEGGGLVEAIERGEGPVLAPDEADPFGIDFGCLGAAGGLCRIGSVRRLFGSLRDRYVLVVVDSPAVFAGQQTLTVAAAADETVLVVDAERTALADVARARGTLEQRGAAVLGMVLNKSRPSGAAPFGGRA